MTAYSEEAINYTAFYANLHVVGFWKGDVRPAMNAMKQALENPEALPFTQDLRRQVAAQWIISYGPGLFQQIDCVSDVWDGQMSCWRLARPTEILTLEMWQQWREGFHERLHDPDIPSWLESYFTVVCNYMTAIEAALMPLSVEVESEW